MPNPGRPSATRQKTSCTPSACSAGFDVVVGPDRDAAGEHQNIGFLQGRGDGGRVASSVSATTPVRSTCAPECVASAASVAALELCS